MAELSPGEQPKRQYTPWEESYANAVSCAGLAVLSLWIAYLVGRFGGSQTLMVAVSLGLMCMGGAFYMRGASREFGKRFEEKWVRKASNALEGTGAVVLPSRMTKVGDIDFYVQGPTGKKINIEIKSWRSYGEDEKFASRERKGIAQIHAQRGAVDADISILWLPQSSRSWLKMLFEGKSKIDEDVYLCCGNARKLRKQICKLG